MKVTVERDALAPALDTAFACVQRKAIIPILSCFRLTAGNAQLRVTANDMDASIEVSIPAQVDVAGDVAVSAETLRTLVRNSAQGAQVAIDATGQRASVRISRSRYAIAAMATTDWPPSRTIDDADHAARFIITARDVSPLFQRGAPFVPDIEKRPTFAGMWLHIHEGRLWSLVTNGTHLLGTSSTLAEGDSPAEDFHFTNANGEERDGIVIPANTADGLARVLQGGGVISTNGNTIVAEAGGVRFAGGLIDNRFPPAWRVVPPIGECRVTVDRGELVATLKRLTALQTNETHLVLRASPGDDMLSAYLLRSSQEGEESLRMAEEADATFAAAFQLPLMVQMMAALTRENVTLSLPRGQAVRVEDGDDGETVAVIMTVTNPQVDAIIAGAEEPAGSEEPADA
ncbi:hypothetical protein [Xanthobacter flavus]|uniref:hypothetical protein n=1 Tax=Xanthobacter flavus TaxID=281 RepID=UPI003728BB54